MVAHCKPVCYCLALPINKLSQVDEDPGETGKKGYVNFKRVVWHKAFFHILELIQLYGKLGFQMKCGDDIVRWLFPILLILSADYEEQ